IRDATRQDSWRVITCRVRPAVGAGKVAVEVTRVVADVRKHPVDPLRIEQRLDLAHRPPPVDRSPAEAYESAVPVPLVWVLVRRRLGPAAYIVGTENSQGLCREIPRSRPRQGSPTTAAGPRRSGRLPHQKCRRERIASGLFTGALDLPDDQL